MATMKDAIFTALAEPNRRRIIETLAASERSVGELAAELGLAQPAMSKHLKVLRESGFVSRQVAAQQRRYRLEPSGFAALDAWMAPYRRLWTRHLDALARHLDEEAPNHDDT